MPDPISVTIPQPPGNDGFSYVLTALNGVLSWQEGPPIPDGGGPRVPFFDGEHWDITNVGESGQKVTATNTNKAVFANDGAG